jgi:hypothetical protein
MDNDDQENEGGPRGGACASLRDLTRGVDTAGTKTAVWMSALKTATVGAGGSAKWLPLKQKGQCCPSRFFPVDGIDLPSSSTICLMPDTVQRSIRNCGASVARACAIVGISAWHRIANIAIHAIMFLRKHLALIIAAHCSRFYLNDNLTNFRKSNRCAR